MAIADRDLKVGTKLVATYKKQAHHAQVVEGEGGKLRYRLEDGREFKSLSAAGTAVTGKSCNGWTFWSVEEAYDWAEVTDKVEKTEQSEASEPALEPTAFRRVPNQRGVPEGHVRLYCDSCAKSFSAPTCSNPVSCPAGHRPDGVDPDQKVVEV